MKKFLLALVVLSGVAFSGFAQKAAEKTSKFSIGVDAGIPVGNARNVYNLGIGGSLKYDMSLSKEAAFTVSAGYTSLMVKGGGSLGYVPLKAGLKYYFADSFYGEGQLGAAFSTSSGGGTSFVYAPGIGYNFGGGVDLGVRYEAWSHNGTISQVAARLALSF